MLPPPPPPPPFQPPKDMLPQEFLDEQAHVAIKLIADTSADALALAAAEKKAKKKAAQKAKKAFATVVTAAVTVPGEEKEAPPPTSAAKMDRLLMQLETKALLGMRPQNTAQEKLEDELENLPSSSRGGPGDSKGGTSSHAVGKPDVG